MKDIVYCYIENCHTYKYTKLFQIQEIDLLKPLSILTWFWTNITLNLWTEISLSSNYDIVTIMIEELTNKTY